MGAYQSFFRSEEQLVYKKSEKKSAKKSGKSESDLKTPFEIKEFPKTRFRTQKIYPVPWETRDSARPTHVEGSLLKGGRLRAIIQRLEIGGAMLIGFIFWISLTGFSTYVEIRFEQNIRQVIRDEIAPLRRVHVEGRGRC